PSTSAFFTHSCSVWAEQPIFWETETTAAQRDGYSPPCSSTIRTARVRTSGENLFVVLLIRLYPTWELALPPDPARSSPPIWYQPPTQPGVSVGSASSVGRLADALGGLCRPLVWSDTMNVRPEASPLTRAGQTRRQSAG